ncbi:MAG: hypothetical protein JHD16_02395 [Solirubrobacteraceae bacterium]|nr:hypothetical protein [Solirubrobacteraceae bacterium]
MSGIDHVPDARDGLTLTERRVLLWLGPSDERMQVCRVVIDRARRQSDLGRGEVYSALITMQSATQSRYPLVDGDGDFAAFKGGPIASTLDTEARRSAVGDAMFGPGDRRFNREARHVTVRHEVPLQGAFPALLANGAAGGLACVPPHHLGELVDAITARIDDPNLDLAGLTAHMPGPDYPGGGELVDSGELMDAYATGRGAFRLRTGRDGQGTFDEEVEVLLVAVVDGAPQQCSLLELIDHYVGHQRAVRAEQGAVDADAELKADLAALAAAHGGERRTRITAAA